MLEVILDTETTGLSTKEKHRIVEIGCIELDNQIPTNKIFHNYINPQRSVSEDAYKVHGYSNEFLSNKQKFTEIADDFIKFINNKNIIIDRMLFDLGKSGAADIAGLVNNKDNKMYFSFKKNLFIDKPKKFYSRLGVSSKNKEPENIYLSGKFNINSAKITFDELIVNSKINNNDIKFYEDEFNQILFENGYKTFFQFFNLKEFVKTVNMEKN